MASMRLVGVVLVVATWMGFHSSNAEATATAWSANGAGCVPVGTVGVHVEPPGAVTAGGGVTVTLYCAITRDALAGGFKSIEITYEGGFGGIGPLKASTTSELIEMSKATGSETVKCGITSKGSASITTQCKLCENSELDFNNNFYYVRIVLKSGIDVLHGQTIYGSSLVDDCPLTPQPPQPPEPPRKE